MMRVVVIGEGERAAAHRFWYRQAGVELVQAGGDEAMELPVAALYDLCAEAEARRHALDLLLRRRHAAVLLAGYVATTADAAARLVTAARRRRCELVVTGGARFVPAMARLREFVCGGILGAIREVHIQVTMPSVLAAEAMAAGMDLGLWLSGDVAPVAESATPGRTSFQAGTARVTIEGRVAAAQEGTAWRAGIVSDLGQALGAAVFHPGLPGRACQQQSVVITLSGRQRCFELPDADPAGNELAAILARQAVGLPWLALCTAERAARLLAVQEEGAGKVSAARVRSS